MSTSYQGAYSSDVFDPSKRYRIGTAYGMGDVGGFQKDSVISDAELREIQMVSDSFIRQLVNGNFLNGSSINDGFKIVESTSPSNNFKITGGDGTVNGAGLLFVDGFILFLKSDIEYNQQDNSGVLTDDDYTETSIPALTTPGAPRTDEVYVDFYFAEVSNDAGSEYQDTSIKISEIGKTTANRLRLVQDIRVAEGSATPSDGVDGNGIYHKYVKIATINRTASANITDAMITDERTLVNSNKSYQDGTALTIKLKDGEAIGDATHRLSAIYMASKIDYDAEDLAFHRDGAEKMRLTTTGKLGIGTNPTQEFHLFGNSPSAHIQSTSTAGDPAVTLTNADRSWSVQCRGAAFDNFVIRDNTAGSIRLRIDSLGRVGIGTASAGNLLEVGGSAKIYSNLTVEGTTTTVNTETTVTDKMQIDQDDNQTALEINKTATGSGESLRITNDGLSATINAIQTNVSNSSGVIQIDNSGTGPAIRISGSGNNNVGIGTINPQTNLHIESTSDATLRLKGAGGTSWQFYSNTNGDLVIRDIDNSVNPFRIYNGSNNEALNIAADGKVGVGTTNPQLDLHVFGTDGIRFGDGVREGQMGYTGSPAYIFFGSRTNFPVAFRVNNSEKMRIVNGGYVGIGTTDPQYQLDICGAGDLRLNDISSDPQLRLFSNYVNKWVIGNSISASHNFYIRGDDGSSDEFLTITQSGLVGIGTTNPLTILSLSGTAPTFSMLETDQAVDSKIWDFRCQGGTFYGRVSNDSESSAQNWLQVNRSGFTVSSVNFPNGSIGIGTGNPLRKLDVINNSGTGLATRSSDSANSSELLFGTDTSNSFAFMTSLANGAGTTLPITFRVGTGGSAEKMRIETDGKVGIGTTQPVGTLEVVTSADELILISDSLTNSTNKDLRFGTKHYTNSEEPFLAYNAFSTSSENIVSLGGGTSLGNAATAIQFFTGANTTTTTGTQRMIIDSSGQVGIGKSPGYLLELSTDSAGKPSTNTWTVTSDKRVKKNIEDFTKYGLDELLKLRPIQFEYNGLGGYTDDGNKHVGYIAQEVEKIIPEMVSISKRKLYNDDKEDTELKTVNTHLLTFALIEAVKELKEEIEILKRRNEN